MRQIILGARRFLAPAGWLALETGIDQHQALVQIARDAGFGRIESRRDLAGRDRFLFAYA